MNKKQNDLFLIIVVISAFVIYTLWAIILPFNKAPDEFQRFDIADFIYKYKQLPIAGDERLIISDYGVTYAPLPMFGYIVSGFLMGLFSELGLVTEKLYLAARLVSVISGTLSVFFVYKICDMLYKKNNIKYFITCFFALIPQFAFLCGYVNQEAISILSTVIIIHALLRGIGTRWNKTSILELGIGFSLCLLSYFNAYIYIPIAGLFFLLTLKGSSKEKVKKLLFLFAIIFILSGWWFIRSYIVYNGDLLGLKTNSLLAEKFAVENLKPSNFQSLYVQGYTFMGMLVKTVWINYTFKSFWGVFGYMNLPIENYYYVLLGGLLILAALGFFIRLHEKIIDCLKENTKLLKFIKDNKLYIALILFIGGTVFCGIYSCYYNDFQPQGRYLFPALFPIVLFIGLGLDKIFNSAYKKYIFFLILLFMGWLNYHSLIDIVYRSYY